MVGSNMLLQVHKRLQQLKASKDDTSFGNISILAIGDLFQLQPVAQPHVFDEVSDMYARLHRTGSLWTDEFSMVELNQIMRDQRFAELLCRVRKTEHTEEDLDLLKTRALEDSDPHYLHDAVHVYHLNMGQHRQAEPPGLRRPTRCNSCHRLLQRQAHQTA